MPDACGRTLVRLARELSGDSPAILARRSDYYGALQAAQSSIDVGEWIAWFAGIVIEALHSTEAQVLFTLDKAERLERLKGQQGHRSTCG